MNKLEIEIIELGQSRYSDVVKRLEKYQSNLFTIKVSRTRLPNADMDWGYSNKLLKNKINQSNSKADLKIGVIDYPLEGNYFAHRLSSTTGVATFHETNEILSESNIDLLNFLLLVIYESIVTLYCCKDSDPHPFYHDETRGCIFDMCGIKQNIVVSASHPTICQECEEKMNKYVLDKDFVATLKKELGRIKVPVYYKISGEFKKHPVAYLVLTGFISFLLNIFSNFVCEIIFNL